ncbi:MAG: hypothetical protein ABIS36_21580 [Chryseolinea sp.]
MTRYLLICASLLDQVRVGVKEGFAQAGHGRKDLISKPSKGDWVVYCSAKDKFESGMPDQMFSG